MNELNEELYERLWDVFDGLKYQGPAVLVNKTIEEIQKTHVILTKEEYEKLQELTWIYQDLTR